MPGGGGGVSGFSSVILLPPRATAIAASLPSMTSV
jgi:hypothetical protein